MVGKFSYLDQTKINYLSTLYVCRYQCTTVDRVGNRYVWQGGQTENQGGQTKFFLEFYQINVCPPWIETLPAPLLR